MLTEESKAAINALSREDLLYEINLGRRSRFQGEKFAYVQTRLATISEAEQRVERDDDKQQKKSDRSFSRLMSIIAILTSVFSLVVGSGWYQEYQKNKSALLQANEQLVSDVLQPISGFLSENRAIYDELKTAPYVEPGWGILDSYLIKIRHDPKTGVKKNVYMKSRIDRLVKNNAEILARLQRYTGKEKTANFHALAQAFRDHATRYESRWQSLIEIYQSDGYFPTAEPIFPTDFPQAVKNEIAERQK